MNRVCTPVFARVRGALNGPKWLFPGRAVIDEKALEAELASQAYEGRCHSAPPHSVPIGILHVNETRARESDGPALVCVQEKEEEAERVRLAAIKAEADARKAARQVAAEAHPSLDGRRLNAVRGARC